MIWGYVFQQAFGLLLFSACREPSFQGPHSGVMLFKHASLGTLELLKAYIIIYCFCCFFIFSRWACAEPSEAYLPASKLICIIKWSRIYPKHTVELMS